MSFERFLPPDPAHHTEDVKGLARGLAEKPHDALQHDIMADALSDAGAEAESVAHRIAAHPDRARDLMHDSPDLHATGVHLSKLAHMVSLHAATATAEIPPHSQFGVLHHHADMRASNALLGSQIAETVATEPGRAADAETRHALAGQNHESLAGYHEARSWEPNGSADRWKVIRDRHETAGIAHRAAESIHHAASVVQREIDTRSWRASRGVE